MSKNPLGQNQISAELIVSVIKSLQEKSLDINPYTVADEAGVLPSFIYQNIEIMNLISKASGNIAGLNTEELLAQIETLTKENQELVKQNEELSAYIQRLNEQEQQESATTGDFPSAVEALAWQEGYYAAIDDMHKQTIAKVTETTAPPPTNSTNKETTTYKEELNDLLNHRFTRPVEPNYLISDEKIAKSSKFVGGAKAPSQELPPQEFIVRNIPNNVRRACLILGIKPEKLDFDIVHKAWRQELSKAHPDTGGDTEIAIYLNHARDTLNEWIESQMPKLGKKFGTAARQYRQATNTKKADQ